jgi:hypothetical protein
MGKSKSKEVRRPMTVKVVRLVLTLAATLVMAASLSFAGSWFGKSSTKSLHVTLDGPARLSNGARLKAGDYTVKIPEHTQTPEVQFYASGKLVAEEQAKVQTEPQRNEITAIETTLEGKSYVVTAVDPGGWPEKIVFSSSSTQHGS